MREVDVVAIATPNVVHAPTALVALERGLHVVVDKPLSKIEDVHYRGGFSTSPKL